MSNPLQLVPKTTAAISPVHEIVAELKAGRMVILVDEEDRENEGDLVIAAEHITPEAINFMARHIGVAIFLTASTTSIGFLTDAISDVPLIVDFGYTAAFALTANFFTTALLMPLMLLM